MNKQTRLVGLFLTSISFAMFIMGIVYATTKNMNYGWIGFGAIYTGAILGILVNKKLKVKLKITDSKIFRKSSIIILALGLILSFAIGSNFGEREMILGVLATVGLHFIPFPFKSAFMLAFLVILNSVLGFFLTSIPIVILIFSDGIIKLIVGIYLCRKK